MREGHVRTLLQILRSNSRWLDWDGCEEQQPAPETLELVQEVWESNPFKKDLLKRIWTERLPHLQLDDNEIVRRVALLLEDEENGKPVWRIEHDNLYFDIYNRGVKEVSVRYIKAKDELNYIFYTKVPYFNRDLTLGSIHSFLQTRIGDIYIKRGEELDLLRKTKGKRLKDHLVFKFYKRNMPMEEPKDA